MTFNIQNNPYIRYQETDGVMIPIVNLSAMCNRNSEEKIPLAKALGDSCRSVGFFYVEHHGVPDELLKLAQQATRNLFNLPIEEKLDMLISKSPFHRGYVPSGEDGAYGSDQKDIKEAFDVGLELPLDDVDVQERKPFHGPNTFPTSLPEFKPTMLWLYRECQRLCEDLSELMAIALGLPNGFFIERSQKPLAMLRAAKYPAQLTTDVSGAIGCGTHTDFGIVSLIWQIDIGGLEIAARDGRWFRAPVIPGTFVCPIGDAMGIWTNDYWRAVQHRVINASKLERHSLIFFYDHDYDCLMEPQPRFIDAINPKRHAPITTGAYLIRGIDGTFEYRKT